MGWCSRLGLVVHFCTCYDFQQVFVNTSYLLDSFQIYQHVIILYFKQCWINISHIFMINLIYYLKTCKINNGYICNDSFCSNFIQQLEKKQQTWYLVSQHVKYKEWTTHHWKLKNGKNNKKGRTNYQRANFSNT